MAELSACVPACPEDQAEQNLIQMQGKTRRRFCEEWSPQRGKPSLKSSLLMNKIIEKENIEVSDNEELDEELLKKQAEQNNMDASKKVKEAIFSGKLHEYLLTE